MSSAPAPADPLSGELLPEGRFSPVQVLILLLCMATAMLDGFDVLIISFTAPAIVAEWSVDPTQMGLVFSAGLLGMAFGSMLLAPVADIYGRRLVISVCLVLSGVSTYLVCHASSVTELVGLRLLAGLGLGTLLSPLASITGEFSPQKYRNVIVATLVSGTAAGQVVGGLIAAALITEFGWRSIFIGAGVLTVMLGLVFYAVVPESIAFLVSRRQKYPNPLQRVNAILGYIGHRQLASLPQMAASSTEAAAVTSLLTPARRATTLLAWSAFFLPYMTIYFMYSWLPTMLVDAGLPQDRAIRGTVVLMAAAIPGSVIIGWISRWWLLNKLIAGAFVLGTGLLVVFSAEMGAMAGAAPMSLWVVLFAMGVLMSGGFANLYTLALIIYPPHLRSTGLGWCIGLGRGGAVLSPAIAGALISAGVTASVLVLCFAVPTIIAAVCTRMIEPREIS